MSSNFNKGQGSQPQQPNANNRPTGIPNAQQRPGQQGGQQKGTGGNLGGKQGNLGGKQDKTDKR